MRWRGRFVSAASRRCWARCDRGVAGHRVDLVDDERPRRPEHFSARLGGEEEVERLGRGDEHVRRLPCDRLPLGGRRVSRAQVRANLRSGKPEGGDRGTNPAERLVEVLPYVVRERLERRNVDDVGLIAERPLERESEESVERDQERRERLAGAGRGRDERVGARRDRRPPAPLRLGGLAEARREPARRRGMKPANGGKKRLRSFSQSMTTITSGAEQLAEEILHGHPRAAVRVVVIAAPRVLSFPASFCVNACTAPGNRPAVDLRVVQLFLERIDVATGTNGSSAPWRTETADLMLFHPAGWRVRPREAPTPRTSAPLRASSDARAAGAVTARGEGAPWTPAASWTARGRG